MLPLALNLWQCSFLSIRVLGCRSEPQCPVLYPGLVWVFFLSFIKKKNKVQHFPGFTVSTYQSSMIRSNPREEGATVFIQIREPSYAGALSLELNVLVPHYSSHSWLLVHSAHQQMLKLEGVWCFLSNQMLPYFKNLHLSELRGECIQHSQMDISYRIVTWGRHLLHICSQDPLVEHSRLFVWVLYHLWHWRRTCVLPAHRPPAHPAAPKDVSESTWFSFSV